MSNQPKRDWLGDIVLWSFGLSFLFLLLGVAVESVFFGFLAVAPLCVITVFMVFAGASLAFNFIVEMIDHFKSINKRRR